MVNVLRVVMVMGVRDDLSRSSEVEDERRGIGRKSRSMGRSVNEN